MLDPGHFSHPGARATRSGAPCPRHVTAALSQCVTSAPGRHTRSRNVSGCASACPLRAGDGGLLPRRRPTAGLSPLRSPAPPDSGEAVKVSILDDWFDTRDAILVNTSRAVEPG